MNIEHELLNLEAKVDILSDTVDKLLLSIEQILDGCQELTKRIAKLEGSEVTH